MEYKEENYKHIIREMDKLIPKFAEEVDIYPDKQIPDFNHELLSSIEDLQVITARENGELVGFHVSFIQYDIFYKNLLTCAVLFYYLLPENRGNGNGTGMFEYAEKLYKDKKVKRVFMSRKIHIDNEKMFKKLGYSHIEANYTKSIK